MKRAVVLIACRNRRDQTLRCLEGLRSQQTADLELEVFLVDDGSTDGTSDAVRATNPAVHVIRGTGHLFWGGAMRLADATAWPSNPDYVLWLNDDVVLLPDAVKAMVAVAKLRHDAAIVVGAVANPISGTVSYGGHRAPDQRRPITYQIVAPTGRIEEVDAMNGNVVLIPASVRKQVGSLDPAFSHNMADIDYALRARGVGFAICLAPHFVGVCEWNYTKAARRLRDTPLHRRWLHVASKKGTPPREWYLFTRRHAGRYWPRYFLAPFVRAIVPSSSQESQGDDPG